MRFATLRLSKENDHTQIFDLKYTLIDNHFTKKWIDRVLEAQQKQYQISEPWAVYNLNDRLNEEFVIQKLNTLIKAVDEEELLFDISINSVHDQDQLNKIHAVFETHHGKLDKWQDNPIFKGKSESFRKNLSEINQFVHACESTRGVPKIRVVWFDLPKVNQFTEEDYKLFTNYRSFGSLYHLYADVGKNLESLAKDNDQHHHDLVPNIHYSADCVAYFCNDTKDTVRDAESKTKAYVENNKDYIISQGYSLDDPRLTTGRIELGRIENIDQETIMSRIKDYDYIQSFFLS